MKKFYTGVSLRPLFLFFLVSLPVYGNVCVQASTELAKGESPLESLFNEFNEVREREPRRIRNFIKKYERSGKNPSPEEIFRFIDSLIPPPRLFLRNAGEERFLYERMKWKIVLSLQEKGLLDTSGRGYVGRMLKDSIYWSGALGLNGLALFSWYVPLFVPLPPLLRLSPEQAKRYLELPDNQNYLEFLKEKRAALALDIGFRWARKACPYILFIRFAIPTAVAFSKVGDPTKDLPELTDLPTRKDLENYVLALSIRDIETRFRRLPTEDEITSMKRRISQLPFKQLEKKVPISLSAE